MARALSTDRPPSASSLCHSLPFRGGWPEPPALASTVRSRQDQLVPQNVVLETGGPNRPLEATSLNELCPFSVELTVHPLTPELWPALEELFGDHGASNGCWCMYWRIGSAYHKRPREKNRVAFHTIVDEGPPPGLLAFHGDRPVGWCQLTPRADLPWLNRTKVLQPVDNKPVWSVSCFYVRAGFRRQGVMKALIQAAVMEAKRQGAPALEAYPIDTDQPDSSRNVFTGSAAVFAHAGFKVVAARSPQRPIMRHDLRDKIRKG